MIASGRLDIRALVDRVTSIDQAPKVYAELAAGGASQPLGVIIEYPEDTRALPEPSAAPKITIRGHRRPPEGPLRYALVGAGAFGQSMLVPQMAKRRDLFFLRGVVSRNATQGGNFARVNQAEVFASGIDEVLAGDGFDLMVIATRHHEHAEQAVKGLRAGKHVFVEKPLAVTWDQLELVGRTIEEMETPPMLMVGFNRRFSPAVQKLRETVEGRRGPMVVNYILNGGYIPKDHWIQGPHGGGRNIGEACHMYDVFRSLAGAPVTSIKASAIDPGSTAYMKTDNFIATLTYADGSVCSLMYTANGPKQGLPKERIEVHCDGEAYLVDNFMRLIRAGDGKTLWEGQEVDKGHFTELSRFGEAIKSGGEPPIPLEEIMETTAVSLKIEDILNGRAVEE
jgi:predicted dehydrogenase